jgi:2-polyprenyl-3-methyl-5-hydroxy-6-metoxy-1,4-benzoquinol methylase
MTLADFMRQVASETYPEPITEGHLVLTRAIAPVVAALVHPGCQVLDVGCGQGPALEWFTENGFFITGTALNPEDVKACQEKGFRVFQHDMNEMPDAWTGTYSLVWARHVLEHSVCPIWTLHEFHRVLKPGGILYLEMPAPDTACWHTQNRNHYSVLGFNAWASLIDRAGFEILDAKGIPLETPAGKDMYFSFICKRNG